MSSHDKNTCRCWSIHVCQRCDMNAFISRSYMIRNMIMVSSSKDWFYSERKKNTPWLYDKDINTICNHMTTTRVNVDQYMCSRQCGSRGLIWMCNVDTTSTLLLISKHQRCSTFSTNWGGLLRIMDQETKHLNYDTLHFVNIRLYFHIYPRMWFTFYHFRSNIRSFSPIYAHYCSYC